MCDVGWRGMQSPEAVKPTWQVVRTYMARLSAFFFNLLRFHFSFVGCTRCRDPQGMLNVFSVRAARSHVEANVFRRAKHDLELVSAATSRHTRRCVSRPSPPGRQEGSQPLLSNTQCSQGRCSPARRNPPRLSGLMSRPAGHNEISSERRVELKRLDTSGPSFAGKSAQSVTRGKHPGMAGPVGAA